MNVYDFLSLADGKAIPYGIYDLVHKSGFVNVGIDHETAEFAVESIRRWWQTCGKTLYPNHQELLITADGGGSNGVKNRLWKKKLQDLANEEQLTITVAHYPPATSKWNKIEHRLFSFISINWRAKPLTSLEVVLELLSHTTTKEGLSVTAIKDSNTYPTGIKVSDEELAALKSLGIPFTANGTIPSSLRSDQLIFGGVLSHCKRLHLTYRTREQCLKSCFGCFARKCAWSGNYGSSLYSLCPKRQQRRANYAQLPHEFPGSF